MVYWRADSGWGGAVLSGRVGAAAEERGPVEYGSAEFMRE